MTISDTMVAPDKAAMPCQNELPLVSVVCPVYNEADSLPELVRRLTATCDGLADRFRWEFILVDDGSRDGSQAIATGLLAQEPRLVVIELRGNFGQTAALQAGFDHAVGDIVVSMDADLQHFPEEIPAFLTEIEAGADVVCGWRHQRQEGIIRRWPSRVANFLIRRISGLDIHDIGTTFRAYRREVVQDFLLLGENHRFVPVFAKAHGARITEIPIKNIERPHGQSNYGISRTLNVFIDLFFLYFFTHYIDRPIRIFGKISLVAAGLGGVIGLVLMFVWLVHGVPVVRDHSGWFILAVMLLLAALQVLLTGIVSEMLARMYYTKDRRPYALRAVRRAC
ncbi:MAG: glycosyltransferase family 2 protein [Rhodospirillaceae bacterium]|nr:glycosyltransferase family 2 protein [Rhodospirillales bacterium]